MNWSLQYSKKAVKQLSKLDQSQRALILSWMHKNIDGCDDPRIKGKALSGDLAGVWRYRIGNYRVLCELHDKELVVLTVAVGHRREIYDR